MLESNIILVTRAVSGNARNTALREVIDQVRAQGTRPGFCGQDPGDKPEYAKFLVDCEVDSISVVRDSVIGVHAKKCKS
jgi:phosphoenolpyruvate synthase/pyruvate phosphate dikinase